MKIVKFLLFVILILAIVFIYKIYVSSDGYVMSKSAVKSLLEKGQNCDNFSCEYTMDDIYGKRIKKVKGNIVSMKNDNMYIWSNLNTNEKIMISYDKNVALIGSDFGLVTKNSFDITSYFDNPIYEFKYLRKEIYQNSSCIVIEFKYKDSGAFNFSNASSYNVISNIWIDQKNRHDFKI